MSIQEINTDRLYTSEEVTEYLRVSLRTTQRLLKTGQLPSFKVHGQYRIKGIEILNYLNGVRIDSDEDNIEEDKPANLISLLEIHPITVELGIDLIPLADPAQEGEIFKKIPDIRKNITLELGFIMPGIQFKDNISLGKNEYNILIDGLKVADGKIEKDKFFARAISNNAEEISDYKVIDPLDDNKSDFWPIDNNNNACWINEELKEKALNSGYEVITPIDLLLRHIGKIAKSFSHEILNREEVSVIIENIRKKYPVIVNELLDYYGLTIGELTKILKGLLYEQVSIQNIRLILEGLSDSLAITKNKDIDILVEMTRQKLSRQICTKLADKDKVIDIIVLSEKISKVFNDSICHTAEGSILALNPAFSQKFSAKVKEIIQNINQPVILTDPNIRRYVKRVLARNFPKIVVLSYKEVNTMVKIRCINTIDIEEA